MSAGDGPSGGGVNPIPHSDEGPSSGKEERASEWQQSG
jgi:hypothetical protein